METIQFLTREGDLFIVPLKLIKCMRTIWDMINDESGIIIQDSNPIILKKIRTKTLEHILHWSHYHLQTDLTPKETEQDIQPTPKLNNSSGISRQDETQGFNFTQIFADKNHLSDEIRKIDFWDKNFFSSMPFSELFQVMAAADYLNIQLLEHQTCVYVADKIQGKTTDEFRKYFGIKNDFARKETREMKIEELITSGKKF